MSEASSLVRSVGAVSTAVLTFGACGAPASSFDFPEYTQPAAKQYNRNPDEYDRPLNLLRLVESDRSTSGSNSSAFRFYIDSNVSVKLIEEIKNLLCLDIGWDGYQAEVPTKKAISDAIKLIKLFPDDKLPNRVGISNDGEISLIWESAELFADFGLIGDGTYTYFIENRKRKLYGDEIPLTNRLPIQALELLG